MSTIPVDEVYEKFVRPLSPSERLRLLEWTARDLDDASPVSECQPANSILELRGLGEDLWAGVDPDRYVDELRDEWDRRAMRS